MTQVSSLHLYPLKGARGLTQTRLRINPSQGVVNTRRFGIKRRADVPDTWGPKGKFRVCMNTAALAAEVPRFSAASDDWYALDSAYLQDLAERINGGRPLSILDTQGAYALTDSKTPYVSLLNLATVDALSTYVGRPVDPRRFRMDVWLSGLKPLEELSWIDAFPGTRRISIGSMRLRVDDACERCKAIEASPTRGEYNFPLLKALEGFMHANGYFGSPHRNVHTVMGILACPETTGTITLGDKVTLL